jgi:hypothetical protein
VARAADALHRHSNGARAGDLADKVDIPDVDS